MTKNCLILMPYGSEVRQFGHSGMIDNLINHGWHIIGAAEIVDADLANQLDPRVELIPLIHEPTPRILYRIRKLLDRSHQIFETKQGKSKWNYAPEKSNSFRVMISNKIFELCARLVSHAPLFYKKLIKFEQYLEKCKISKRWLALLIERKIDSVIVNIPRSEILDPALIAAQELGIPRLLFYHTIKDIAANGRIIHSFSSIGVWNSWMKNELIRQNTSTLDPSVIHIAGCAHFDCVGRNDFLLSEDKFRKIIGANPTSRLLLFPASTPWVVPDEGRYIKLLVNAIKDGILPKDIQIVIRTNPMDLSEYISANFDNCPNVLIQKADWRMENNRSWNFQRRNDIVVYNSLLHYSSLCIGIPSTVTIECAISCLPVINLGFDLPGPVPLPGSMKAFWNADFYQDEVRYGVASLSESENDLISKINIALVTDKPKPQDYESFLSNILGILPPLSANKYFELIDHIVTNQCLQ